MSAQCVSSVFVADLSTAITSEAMIPVLANADVQQRLIPLLPEAAELPKTEAELRETMHSPQFHQVPVNVLCEANVLVLRRIENKN